MRKIFAGLFTLIALLLGLGLSACDAEKKFSSTDGSATREISEAITTSPTNKPLEPTSTVEIIETVTVLPTDTPTSEPTPAPTGTSLPPTPSATPAPLALNLTSTAIDSGGFILEQYARNGNNVSPPITWSDPPEGTESFAILFVSDPLPDAGGTWVLWTLYNIPASLPGIPEGLVPDEKGVLAIGRQHLEYSYLELAYSGPSPHPIETRRFYLRIYALDTVLEPVDIENAAADVDTWIGGSEQILLNAMDGHILAKGQLSGKYKGESPTG